MTKAQVNNILLDHGLSVKKWMMLTNFDRLGLLGDGNIDITNERLFYFDSAIESVVMTTISSYKLYDGKSAIAEDEIQFQFNNDDKNVYIGKIRDGFYCTAYKTYISDITPYDQIVAFARKQGQGYLKMLRDKRRGKF